MPNKLVATTRHDNVSSVAKIAGWIALFVVVFIGAQVALAGAVRLLFMLGITWPINSTISLLTYRVVLYAMTALIVWAILRWRYGSRIWQEMGLARLLQWRDIGLTIPAAIVYIICTFIVLLLASKIPGFDAGQGQDLGFTKLFGGELLGAFVVLVILTPFFEELIFRGMLYGRLRAYTRIPWWGSAVLVSVLFGLAHMQWNVGLDVFCLSMVACALRELTGSIWVGILLHTIKNMVAFLVIFGVLQGVMR